MFRIPAARLRQLATPLLRRGALRKQTSATEHAVKSRNLQRPFWTSGRVLLFSALTGTTTYYYGATDETPRFHLPWVTSSKPRYAHKADMERASCENIANCYVRCSLPRQAIAELRYALGDDAISTDDEDLHLHGYSEWSSINIDQLPVAVAYPKSTEEVSQIAKVCHRYRIPMSTANTFKIV